MFFSYELAILYVLGRGREVGMVMFTSRLIAFCVGIYNTEFVMTGVVRQRLEYEAYPFMMHVAF